MLRTFWISSDTNTPDCYDDLDRTFDEWSDWTERLGPNAARKIRQVADELGWHRDRHILGFNTIYAAGLDTSFNYAPTGEKPLYLPNSLTEVRFDDHTVDTVTADDPHSHGFRLRARGVRGSGEVVNYSYANLLDTADFDEAMWLIEAIESRLGKDPRSITDEDLLAAATDEERYLLSTMLIGFEGRYREGSAHENEVREAFPPIFRPQPVETQVVQPGDEHRAMRRSIDFHAVECPLGHEAMTLFVKESARSSANGLFYFFKPAALVPQVQNY